MKRLRVGVARRSSSARIEESAPKELSSFGLHLFELETLQTTAADWLKMKQLMRPYMYNLTLTRRVVVATFSLLTAGTTFAASVCIFPDPKLPPLGGEYRPANAGEIHALFASGQFQLIDPIHFGFLDTFDPPALGQSTIHSFGSTVSMMLSADGGTTFNPVENPAGVAVRVDSTHGVGDTRFFDTEMLQLDLVGGVAGGLPPGVIVRESPTLASRGKTTIQEVPGGYQIDSFFDIFVELSIDNGQTWMPSEARPVRMVLNCPESGSTLPLLLVPVLLLAWKSRDLKALTGY
ncbi:MAG: hypothetical protein ACKV19_25440 [Verrucomicrobiales bacterium]